MAKRKDFSSAEGVHAWRLACGFTSDKEAAIALGAPFRTYCRWKKQGLPTMGMSRIAAKEFILNRMEEILADCKK